MHVQPLTLLCALCVCGGGRDGSGVLQSVARAAPAAPTLIIGGGKRQKGKKAKGKKEAALPLPLSLP